jgi:hypothetical protein
VILHKLKYLIPWCRQSAERDMNDELAALADLAEPGALGNLTLAAENARETWLWMPLESFIADLRDACREIRKNPGFAAVAILTLGVGIGANTAMFSVVNAMLLRPLPVRDPYRLAVLAPREKGAADFHDLAYADYRDYRAQSRAFSDMLGFTLGMEGLAAGGRPDQVLTSYVTGNYFSMLGVQPAYGRLLDPGQSGEPGAEPVLVLGYRFWQRRFGGDLGVIGKSVKLSGRAAVIAGVAPNGFRGTFPLAETDVYAPLNLFAGNDRNFWTARGRGELRVIGRLRRDTNLRQARAELQVIARSLGEHYPETNRYVSMEAYPEWQARPQADAVQSWPLMVGVFLALAFTVLLVACVNLANILRARAKTRETEMAVRSSLGAARSRLARQLLTETLVLAAAGAAAGILLSASWIRPPSRPEHQHGPTPDGLRRSGGQKVLFRIDGARPGAPRRGVGGSRLLRPAVSRSVCGRRVPRGSNAWARRAGRASRLQHCRFFFVPNAAHSHFAGSRVQSGR